MCLVTGGTSGLGADAAVHLAAEGCKVVITGRREDKGKAVVAEMKKAGGEGAFIKADGTTPHTTPTARVAAALGGQCSMVATHLSVLRFGGGAVLRGLTCGGAAQ